MTAWIALLRGVNVGGVTITNAELARVFAGLGFQAVRTVLASGNVAFEATGERAALKTAIETALRSTFDYEAWIVLVTADEMRHAIDGFPFDETDAARQPWVVFCVDAQTRDELAAASVDPDLDPLAIGSPAPAVGDAPTDAGAPGVVYWNPPKGSSTDTPFAKMLARAAYKPRTTNRNLRTLAKIVG